jgi:predicted nucleotidyltransferase
VIPFGEIARLDQNIYWPPEETPVMSVSGFAAMAKKALTIVLDGEFPMGVASLPGLFVLKLAAWNDRHLVNNKDADDIAGLLDEYLDINLERSVIEHADIYESHDFTTFTAGAILMARDIRGHLADDLPLREEVGRILLEEIDAKEQSKLIRQILETHRLKKYEEVLRGLTLMEGELKK